MKRKLSIKTLKKRADKLLSEFVRKRDKGQCVTCGDKKHWASQQAGHFISRVHLGTRYSEKNVNCQCVRCNIFLHGNMIAYYEFMLKTCGEEVIEELKLQSHASLSKEDLLGVIDFYSNKLKEV